MTNKLPEVGSKYKNKQCYDNVYVVTAVYPAPFTKRLAIEAKPEFLHCRRNNWILSFFNGTLEEFWDCFEELSEDNSKEKPTVKENLTVDEVEKAKEELKNFLNRPIIYIDDMQLAAEEYNKLVIKAQNLLNALDNIKTEAKPVVDNKIESRLPWKDVSELPDKHSNVIIQFKNDRDYEPAKFITETDSTKSFFTTIDFRKEFIKDNIERFISLKELINSIESMLSRQDELEERIKKLEGEMTKKQKIEFIDKCAMKALQGLLANDGINSGVALYSYDIAYWMLEEKLKRQKEND